MFLVRAAAMLADPIALAGYIAAGALLPRLYQALVTGAVWAVAMEALVAAINAGGPGYSFGNGLAPRLAGSLAATALVFGIATIWRQRRATAPKAD